jgi:signal transduction histidine kinase
VDNLTKQILIEVSMFFFGSFPQDFFSAYLGMMFLGHRVPRMWQKLFLFSAVGSVVTLVMFRFTPVTIRPAFAFLVYVSLITLLMRELSLRSRLWLGFFVIVSASISELTVGYLALTLGLDSYNQMVVDPRRILILAPIPYTIAGLLAYLMDKKEIHPGRAIFLYMETKANKYLFWILGFFVTNVILSIFAFISAMDGKGTLATFLITLIMIFGLCIFLLTVRALSRTEETAVLTTQEVYIENINSMFNAIRGQRHDFLNHVQVIHSLVQLGKYGELKRYTKELVGEIAEMSELLQIGNPALASLIQSKTVQAMNGKIDFRYHFEGMEQLKGGISSLDFVKIAGNLIDNALDEVKERPPEDRWVEVKGWLEADSFNMTVRNPSRKLSEEELSLLFVPGYSTKGTGGHSGLGLSIVKDRVSHYKGAVDVKSAADQGTTFAVKIPLQRNVIGAKI